MKVFRVIRIVDNTLIFDVVPPDKAGNGSPAIVSLLWDLPGLVVAEDGPSWTLEIVLGDGAKSQRLPMPLMSPIITKDECERSQVLPVCFSELTSVDVFLNCECKPGENTYYRVAASDLPVPESPDKSAKRALAKWLWLFRDGIYSTDKPPQLYEPEEVLLRIKSLHFQRDERLRRLREQVANFEAIETNLGREKSRRPLPDDVKLLVWSRDGGACVKCGSQSELHFDHIIAFARGGSDEAENIQLLCRSCNLAKSDRLT